jgi:hypothetical protein
VLFPSAEGRISHGGNKDEILHFVQDDRGFVEDDQPVILKGADG